MSLGCGEWGLCLGPGKDYESPLPARTDARYFLSMAAFRILRLNPGSNTLSFVKILIAMCRIPENNSAAFPLLILQSSSFITTSRRQCSLFSTCQWFRIAVANFSAVKSAELI